MLFFNPAVLFRLNSFVVLTLISQVQLSTPNAVHVNKPSTEPSLVLLVAPTPAARLALNAAASQSEPDLIVLVSTSSKLPHENSALNARLEPRSTEPEQVVLLRSSNIAWTDLIAQDGLLERNRFAAEPEEIVLLRSATLQDRARDSDDTLAVQEEKTDANGDKSMDMMPSASQPRTFLNQGYSEESDWSRVTKPRSMAGLLFFDRMLPNTKMWSKVTKPQTLATLLVAPPLTDDDYELEGDEKMESDKHPMVVIPSLLMDGLGSMFQDNAKDKTKPMPARDGNKDPIHEAMARIPRIQCSLGMRLDAAGNCRPMFGTRREAFQLQTDELTMVNKLVEFNGSS